MFSRQDTDTWKFKKKRLLKFFCLVISIYVVLYFEKMIGGYLLPFGHQFDWKTENSLMIAAHIVVLNQWGVSLSSDRLEADVLGVG